MNATQSYLGWSWLAHFLKITKFLPINTLILPKVLSSKVDYGNLILEHLNKKLVESCVFNLDLFSKLNYIQIDF